MKQIIKHPEQRVGVFIDAQNFYHTARRIYGAKVNFEAVVKELVADRKLVRSIAYVIRSESEDDGGDEQGFFEALVDSGIEVKIKDLQVFPDGNKKADWDVGLAIDAITLAPKLDVVVILSGDGDYVPAVKYLQHHSGIQVEVGAFGQSTSSSLVDAADGFTDLADNPKQFLIGYRARRTSTKKKSLKTKKKESVAVTKKKTTKKETVKSPRKSKKKTTTKPVLQTDKHVYDIKRKI